MVTSVSHCTLGDKPVLFSVAWDHRLILWDLALGTLIAEVFLSAGVSSIGGASNNDSGACVKEDDERNDDDENEEKTYDETAAGDFPIRVVSALTEIGTTVAVIFKGLQSIQIFRVSLDGFDSERIITIPLPSLPCDLIIAKSGLLIVLLPAPYYLQAFDILRDGFRVSDYRPIEMFQRKCLDGLNPVFSQRLDSSAANGECDDDLKGMRKHVLDRRFDAIEVNKKSTHFNSPSHTRGKKRRDVKS